MDPKKIVMTLKAELRKQDLLISGKKANLIARLNQDDPSEEWIKNRILVRFLEATPDNIGSNEYEEIEKEKNEKRKKRREITETIEITN